MTPAGRHRVEEWPISVRLQSMATFDPGLGSRIETLDATLRRRLAQTEGGASDDAGTSRSSQEIADNDVTVHEVAICNPEGDELGRLRTEWDVPGHPDADEIWIMGELAHLAPLAIAWSQSLARLAGGTYDVSSRSGTGTRVRIELPAL